MNLFQFPVTCGVCGGGGMGDHNTAAAAWIRGSFISHTDPRVCADTLRARKEELERKEQKLASNQSAS